MQTAYPGARGGAVGGRPLPKRQAGVVPRVRATFEAGPPRTFEAGPPRRRFRPLGAVHIHHFDDLRTASEAGAHSVHTQRKFLQIGAFETCHRIANPLIDRTLANAMPGVDSGVRAAEAIKALSVRTSARHGDVRRT